MPRIKNVRDKTDDWRGSWKRSDRYGSHARTIADMEAEKKSLPVLNAALVDSVMLANDLKETLRELGIKE